MSQLAKDGHFPYWRLTGNQIGVSSCEVSLKSSFFEVSLEK